MKISKKILTAVAALVAMTGTAFADLEQKTEQMFNTVVQVGDGCTGTIISSKFNDDFDVQTDILSARHCFDRVSLRDPVEVKFFNYNDQNRLVSTTVYRGELSRKSYLSDLAIVTLRDDDTWFIDRVAEVAPEDTEFVFGMPVHVVGHPGVKSLTYTQGHLGFVEDDMFSRYSKSGQFYRATPLVAGGSSGSAMFIETENGYQIAGVLTGGWRFGSWANHFTPLEEIYAFLKTANLTPKEYVAQ